jgi:hypothetical protein
MLGFKRGYIVDILAKSREVTGCLLGMALSYFAKRADLVSCWMLRNHLYYKSLLEIGFVDHEMGLLKLICRFNTRDEEFRKSYYGFEKDWFFTMGDSDAI